MQIIKNIDESVYGIGYLNPAFEDNNRSNEDAKTPKSSPIDIPLRSKKSSGKNEKVNQDGRIIDVSKTVRRRLDMSSIPDVVQTSQPRKESPDEEEFFLAKNSKLFSQVSNNSLTATDSKPIKYTKSQPNSFRIVEVKEMEIVKSVASPEDHVVLPSANVSVEQMPQVVERVEILEDVETEPDTDTEAIENQSTETVKKELIPILKKRRSSEDGSEGKSSKKLSLKLNLEDKDADLSQLLDEALKSPQRSPRYGTASGSPLSLVHESVSVDVKIEKNSLTGLKDPESVAEYLILDDTASNGARKKDVQKKVGFSDTFEIVGNSSNESSRHYRKSPLPKTARSLYSDDTLEDCESFYGSDKETDDVLIFSDDTEIDVSSSSSEGEDSTLGEHVEHLLAKVTWL